MDQLGGVCKGAPIKYSVKTEGMRLKTEDRRTDRTLGFWLFLIVDGGQETVKRQEIFLKVLIGWKASSKRRGLFILNS